MKGNKLRTLVIYKEIEATDRHCNNSCPYLTSDLLETGKCALFSARLEWDKRKKHHGYKRVKSCIQAEERAGYTLGQAAGQGKTKDEGSQMTDVKVTQEHTCAASNGCEACTAMMSRWRANSTALQLEAVELAVLRAAREYAAMPNDSTKNRLLYHAHALRAGYPRGEGPDIDLTLANAITLEESR